MMALAKPFLPAFICEKLAEKKLKSASSPMDSILRWLVVAQSHMAFADEGEEVENCKKLMLGDEEGLEGGGSYLTLFFQTLATLVENRGVPSPLQVKVDGQDSINVRTVILRGVQTAWDYFGETLKNNPGFVQLVKVLRAKVEDIIKKFPPHSYAYPYMDSPFIRRLPADIVAFLKDPNMQTRKFSLQKYSIWESH